MKAKRLIKPLILLLCAIVVLVALFNTYDGRGTITYTDYLDETAVTIDGEAITFADLAFYILYEERVIEEQARIYNPDSTKDYWNVHTNDSFIQLEAKDAVMGMAIHDRLLYQIAKDSEMDELNQEEERLLEAAKTDFWEDLLDCQWDRLPVSDDVINEQIRIAAVAEKYQNYLANNSEYGIAGFKYDGYYYKLIEDEHDIQINKKLWNRFVMGDITLVHTKVNFVIGSSNEKTSQGEE